MPSSKPKLSVLFSAYNSGPYIREAIDSILGQSFGDFELLIADDGSTDNTREIIDSYTDRRIKVFHNETNIGKTTTVQRLFEQSGGDLITVHDADDVSLRDRFSVQLRQFEESEDLAMCGTGYSMMTAKGAIFENVLKPDTYEEILVRIPQDSQFHGPTMIIRRNVLNELGEVYRPYFRDNFEDTDLAYRIAERYSCFNVPKVLYRYRIHADSLCRKNVDVRTRNLYKVVSHLAVQRKNNNGVDDLMSGHPERIEEFLLQTTKRYLLDKSLIYRESASYFNYFKLPGLAVEASVKAIRSEPLKIVNWRTLGYTLRKSLF
jgi:glycosyltransferase involved in cell wall biosynthesis